MNKIVEFFNTLTVNGAKIKSVRLQKAEPLMVPRHSFQKGKIILEEIFLKRKELTVEAEMPDRIHNLIEWDMRTKGEVSYSTSSIILTSRDKQNKTTIYRIFGKPKNIKDAYRALRQDK